MKTSQIRGQVAAVHGTLGMIAVALCEEPTRRYVLPLAASSQDAARLLHDALARRAPVVLTVRGAELLEVARDEGVALARAA